MIAKSEPRCIYSLITILTLTFFFDKKGILWLLRIECMWHFLTIGITAYTDEVFSAPLWAQEQCQPCRDYLKERGKPMALWL